VNRIFEVEGLIGVERADLHGCVSPRSPVLALPPLWTGLFLALCQLKVGRRSGAVRDDQSHWRIDFAGRSETEVLGFIRQGGAAMRRRNFIILVGGALVAAPLAARAQQPMPVIGFLNSASREGYAPFVEAFIQGLKDSGHTDGQNVAIEYRWAEGQYDRLPALIADLVQHQVMVLVATSTLAALAAKTAQLRIPVVFTTSGDPVKLGLVDNLSRPSGNMTGGTQLNVEIGPKRLELMHELLPAATTMALLVNPTNPVAENLSKEFELASRALGLQLHILKASTDAELEIAFATMASLGVSGLVVASADGFFTSRAEQLAALTVRHRVPAIYQNHEFASAGGLISYGGSNKDSYRTAGSYAGRILKGERPENLPVQQVTKIEMIINLKAAKRLGVNIPLPLLGRADEVIE
jgi:putative ABC transport system substrate-binding protein